MNTKVDGIFGSDTQSEVRDYQSRYDLGVDGLAGPQTLGHMGIEVYPGIDLSSHNGEVDFRKVVDAGVKYVTKVTEAQLIPTQDVKRSLRMQEQKVLL